MSPHDTPAARWRLTTLMSAPHRLAFFTAAFVMASGALWWWLEMLSRVGVGSGLGRAVAATYVHALVMSLGFMPLFFAGFLFTAGPKWLRVPEVSARAILAPICAMALGWCLLLIGAAWHRGLAAAGVGLAALGWLALTARFIGLVRFSQAQDRLHASVIAVACSVGVLAMAGASAALAMASFDVVRIAALLGLWWFIVPVYVTVAHRMIPFFTASALPALDAWRPNWLLWTLLGVVGLQGGWVLMDALGSGALAAPLLARALISAACGVLILGLAVRWGLVQSLRIRLLAMLHLGFVWLGLALCLDAVSALWMALDGAGGGLGLMPLHALTMGFLGSVLLAMATRVSCGHSGRTLVADTLAWGMFLALQLAVVMRLAAALPYSWAPWAMALAATVWLLVMGGWFVRHGRWFGLPRVDGRPG